MPNPPKKIISNANDSDSFNELKHRQNYCHIRTGAFTYAMVHLVSRATSWSDLLCNFWFFLHSSAFCEIRQARDYENHLQTGNYQDLPARKVLRDCGLRKFAIIQLQYLLSIRSRTLPPVLYKCGGNFASKSELYDQHQKTKLRFTFHLRGTVPQAIRVNFIFTHTFLLYYTKMPHENATSNMQKFTRKRNLT